MEINNKQDMADVMEWLDGVNASSVAIPTPSDRRNSTGETGRYAATWWNELVKYGEDNSGSWVGWTRGEESDTSELLGYHAVLDGRAVTLIVLSYSQGGFDGCVLVDGHLTSRREIVANWLGDTTIEEHEGSAIIDYTRRC